MMRQFPHALLVLALVLASGLLGGRARAAAQDDEPAGPTKAEVQSAVKALAKGLESKEASERIAALQGAASVVHEDVVKAITTGLKDSVPAVRDFTLDLLGKIEDPSALAALHAYAKRHRRTLPDDPELWVVLLKSIARHGDASSIPHLTDRFFDYDQRAVTRARILGLGSIRDKRAVEALFDFMTKADRRWVTPVMDDVQLSFNVLLGVDHGQNQDRWIAWWNDHRKQYELAPRMPKLPEESLRRWQNFWGLEVKYVRNKKRGERGQDPEGGGDGR